MSRSISKQQFRVWVANRNRAVAGAHLASADTGPEAGAHLTWAETGPEAYNHRSLAPPSISHRSSRWTAWSQSRRNKNRRQPPGSPNPSQSAFDPHPPPHPERVAGRNPMRAAPPRAPAPTPRNHPTTAATLPSPNPAGAYLPTSLPHGRGHPTPRSGIRIPRQCGAPRRRARAARTRLLRGVHHRCMEIRGGGRACELRHAPLLLRVAVGGGRAHQ
jgi:hypothetical protein